MKTDNNKRKGQAAIMGLIMAVMLIMTFAIMAAPLVEFVNIGVNASTNFTHGSLMAVIIHAIPLFIVLMVLVAVVALISGRTT